MISRSVVFGRWRDHYLPLLVFVSVLILYLRTLVPGVFVSDFAEFQYQPARLGLPHPNGFPLYMMLGWVWSALPMDSVAWRMNALSAVGGAMAAALTAAFAMRISQRVSVGLLAAGLLALSPTFWYYSLAAERYTLNLVLLVGALWATWEAAQRQKATWAHLSAFLLGLGLATHPSDALLLPFWLAYLVWRLPGLRRQPTFWVRIALLLVAPLILYLYVPWRWAAFASAPMLPGVDRSSAVYQGMVHVWYHPDLTWASLSHYLVGIGGYAASLAAGGWRDALLVIADLWPLWTRDVPPLALALTALGVLGLGRRDAALTVALVGAAMLVAIMTAHIAQGKPEAYLLPTTWVALFCAAFSLDLVLSGVAAWRRRSVHSHGTESHTKPWRASLLDRLDAGAAMAVALGLLILLIQRYPQLDYSRWTDTQRTWDVTLEHHALPEGAALLGHWSDMTPLWYMQQIDGRRPDLIGLFPPDPSEVIQPWLDSGGALYLAGPLNEYAPNLAEMYTILPWGKLVRILPPGQEVDCLHLDDVAETPAAWPLAIQSWEITPLITSDQPAALRFCWQARTDLPADTFLRLSLRPSHRPALEINAPLLSEWRPDLPVGAGSQGLAVIPIHLPQGAMPGAYTLELLPYRLRDDGSLETWPDVAPVSLGDVTVGPTQRLTHSELGDEHVPLFAPRAGPLRLRAWQVSSLPVRPGDPVQVDLLWEVRAPVQTQMTVALGFRALPTGRPAAAVQVFDLLEPADAPQIGTLVRTSHVLPAPRIRGDRSYLVEARVQTDGRWLNWWPTLRLPVGTVRVQDRPQLDHVPAGAIPVAAKFADVAELSGYEVEPQELRAGKPLSVTLYWRAGQATDLSYTVFVHLRDAGGQIVSQHDGVPAQGELPTNIWLPGEVIADRHELALPPDLAVGIYSLHVGLYSPATGERLPIDSSMPHQDNALQLGSWTRHN